LDISDGFRLESKKPVVALAVESSESSHQQEHLKRPITSTIPISEDGIEEEEQGAFKIMASNSKNRNIKGLNHHLILANALKANERLKPSHTKSSSASNNLKTRTSKPSANNNNIKSTFSSWNELGPYLEKFEELEQLPLFFCHANADSIIKIEDTMAGYRRSGSKWKEVIEYVDVTHQRLPTSPSISPPPSSTTSLPSDPNRAFKSKSTHAEISKSMNTLHLKPLTEIVSTHSSSGSSSSSSSSSSTTTTSPTPPLPAVSNPLKQRYAVSADYSYGHCDILGGKDAELVWERIVEWLDITTSREKDWKFRRRYSAK
jgi:hypothetical protein